MVSSSKTAVTTTARFRVRPLTECPLQAPAARDLIESTWPEHYGAAGPGDAASAIAARMRSTGLPIGFVALHGDRLVGTVALERTSHGALPTEPLWMTGLAVEPSERRKGVGRALIRCVMEHATSSHAAAVWCATQDAAGIVERIGWQPLRMTSDGWKVYRWAVGG